MSDGESFTVSTLFFPSNTHVHIIVLEERVYNTVSTLMEVLVDQSFSGDIGIWEVVIYHAQMAMANLLDINR